MRMEASSRSRQAEVSLKEVERRSNILDTFDRADSRVKWFESGKEVQVKSQICELSSKGLKSSKS